MPTPIVLWRMTMAALNRPLRCAPLAGGACLSLFVQGQASTDLCGFTVGAQWTVGTTCNPLDFDKPNSYGNEMSPANCGGSANDDAFAWFVGTGNPVIIRYTPPSGADGVLHILSGTCAAPVVEGCSDNCCDGAVETVTIATALGSNYVIRVQRWGGNGAMNNGTLCVYNAPPPPSNDNPCGALALAVNASCTYTTATTTNATGTTGVPAPGCASYNGGDVWFSAVVPANGNLNIETSTGAITDGGMALYTAPNCNGPFTLVECDDDDSPNGLMPMINATGLTPGSTIYIRFWEFGNNITGTFGMCATTYVPPPAPGCGDVFYDPGGAGTNYANNVSSTVTICPSSPGDMVVLNFTSFATENFIDELMIHDGPNTSAPLLGSYSGTALPPVIVASNAGGCLTADFDSDGSVTYAGWAANVSCMTPPPGDCVYVLRLNDSNGNGWGSSNVGVRINSGAWTHYTVTTSSNVVFIGVNIGDVIEFNYDNSGPNQGQNAYSVAKMGELPYFTSATPPVAGTTFSHTANCGPPPAAPQDCAGGVTLCSAQNISTSSTSTGVVDDLDPSNQGCLSAGERQGTWYYFSPQTSGSIAFSIAPANGTDDYDFAVWGPYASAQCPSGPPLRCSYDAPGPSTTGLSSTASQTSEGAGGTGWVLDIAANAGEVYVLYIDNYSTSGQAFTLSWQLSGGSTLDCTTLPVELLSLEAEANDPVIHVAWATATEHNSSHFNVQRSLDNSTFTTIGTVHASGNALFRTDYLFVDENPFRGTNYYRLEQVDLDGTTMRTQTVAATLKNGTDRPFLFPNPTADQLYISFRSHMDGQAVLHVRDALGRTIRTTNAAAVRGTSSALLEAHDLASGWYSLHIALPDGTTMPGEGFVRR